MYEVRPIGPGKQGFVNMAPAIGNGKQTPLVAAKFWAIGTTVVRNLRGTKGFRPVAAQPLGCRDAGRRSSVGPFADGGAGGPTAANTAARAGRCWARARIQRRLLAVVTAAPATMPAAADP
jgi:hypothetical protein